MLSSSECLLARNRRAPRPTAANPMSVGPAASTHSLHPDRLALQIGTISPSPMALRLQGSMVILRLVNALVDPLQQKAYAQSVRGLAQTLDLPDNLVELRHESTHGELPTLSVLRHAALQVCTLARSCTILSCAVRVSQILREVVCVLLAHLMTLDEFPFFVSPHQLVFVCPLFASRLWSGWRLITGHRRRLLIVLLRRRWCLP
jgi:hypothetical protein